jgi:dolichyl-diphosphooligosaccharide--protein glycosyltransferase
MVRLMLILAPVACVLAAVALSATLQSFSTVAKQPPPPKEDEVRRYPGVRLAACLTLFYVLSLFAVQPRAAAGGKRVRAAERSGATGPLHRDVGFAVVAGLTVLLALYTFHCVWVTSEAYSSPSIVLAARQPDGSRLIFDDFREVRRRHALLLPATRCCCAPPMIRKLLYMHPPH